MLGSLFVAYTSWGSLLSALIAFLVVWIVYRTIQIKLSPLNKIPGPPGLPIIGNMLLFLKRKDHINLMRELSETYGSVFKHNSGWSE